MTQTAPQSSVFAPQRWGLPDEAVDNLADRLRDVRSRYQHLFKTKTHDTSEYAWVYLRGLLTLDTNRNFANIARRVIDSEDDGQNLQHFMSDSPWPGLGVFDQIQAEVEQRPELQNGVLTLDEYGDERAGDQSAGAGRQHIGRLGKVELGQVAVGVGYYQAGIWLLVDAELYLPEEWFDKAHADLRRRWHIPENRTFATKIVIGLERIRRVKANGLSFEVVTADSVYGRAQHFRAELEAEQLLYVVDVPKDTQVYLTKPVVEVPETPPGKKGRPFSKPRVLNGVQPVEVQSLVGHPDFELQPCEIRHTERGLLVHHCAARQVWTINETATQKEDMVRAEWLLIWRSPEGKTRYSLSNAPLETPLAQLARWRALRYFAERTAQDAKTEAGWDELVARKYRAWLHHTALDALALWFVAEIKLDWAQIYPRDPELVEQLEVVVLPALSMANIRELLKAVLPLKQLSPEQARCLVVRHLVNRSAATRSRLKKARQKARVPT